MQTPSLRSRRGPQVTSGLLLGEKAGPREPHAAQPDANDALALTGRLRALEVRGCLPLRVSGSGYARCAQRASVYAVDTGDCYVEMTPGVAGPCFRSQRQIGLSTGTAGASPEGPEPELGPRSRPEAVARRPACGLQRSPRAQAAAWPLQDAARQPGCGT